MAISVQMPALGESVTEGTVTRWLKQEGDTVAVDEPLLEVSTDKVDTEIPSPAAGVLTKIIAAEDDVVEVGGDLALIGEEGESAPTGDSTPAEEAEPEAEPEPAAAAAAEEAEPEPEAEESAPEQAKPAKPAASGGGDATSVKMPELGESVTEGTVTRWLKKVGDEVAVDEALVEVSTDKVDTEIPSPVAGTLLSISAEEDDVVAVGGELAKIGDAGAEGAAAEPEPKEEPKQEATPEPKAEPKQEAKPEPKAEPKQEAKPEPKPEPKAEPAPAAAGSETDANPYVTPLVRKLAAENNVDLSSVKGTGVGGRIRKQDVLAAAEAAKAPAAGQEKEAVAPAAGQKKEAAPAPSLAHLRGSTQKANRIRQITAKKTRESLQTTAQLTQVHEVDLTKIVALRAKAKKSFSEREGVNLTFLPFFAVAVVDALKAHPNINASYNEDTKEITYYDAEHLGFAVDTEQGLLSPVVHNAGDLSLGGLARAIADIAARARSGNLKPDELSGGTFTITNIGSQGALFDTPILVPPQAAMLGTGAIVKRPRVISDEFGNESIGVRSVAYLPLTYDHRLIDGADAGRFLTTVKRRLEEGAFEADLGL
ncbi:MULTISPECIES: 2-oxoglutarate dehydrogenase, E2 component, dihydrolipoamide succinyltransferase [Mycobacteriaceae]|uniref:Dihydrolipoamide acetyltransferase component of pyruvate dehydrogenase complex n=1 Tax=Mycolicibacterium neoaurum VKM Ac-1815D TaxID=700508 RepID=V5XEV4_MYCNE|nr:MULTISPECIES: 2-oxoglutarate dehydrogenase, E2 component, dihydrolipoamide succinyltransferase [Mycobacteriaceae]AHC26353.1 dihydrolipoamide acetyltransferase [Mycolicibacterium neoaurum VKM Ac-1815D]AMO06708.1 dihydrolipoamide acetyltransferase [Mycolicibacterium neoaurum]AXK74932.1 2-oxoglutarate dehydrogenase, E2 component, dihydrolipoamide succinyltransferase [Mycolicibacterium neoaurum]KJQ48791.1 dihydrolipoamide acetyltransferase [Mycolicibacterium neoaurum]KUM07335.1 dihydrolipoamide